MFVDLGLFMRFLAILDTYLQRLIHWILQKVGVILSILIAILCIAMFIIGPFEYNEGLFDIDVFEIVSIIVFLGLTWRFFKKGHIAGLTKWKIVKDYCFLLTFTSLISSAVMGIWLYIELDHSGILTSAHFESIDNINTFIDLVFTAIMLYAFSPLPLKTVIKNTGNSEKSKSEASNNTDNSAPKDADFNPWQEKTENGNLK